MIGDAPTVVLKAHPVIRSSSKTSWTEPAFKDWFNKKYADKYELMSCNQDYQSFDFWMLNLRSPNTLPTMVELKSHPGKLSTDRELVGCDFIKIQKLRSLAVGTKAYVFHLFEDKLLVQDVDYQVKKLRKTVWNSQEILLALISVEDCAQSLSVGLQDLRLQHEKHS